MRYYLITTECLVKGKKRGGSRLSHYDQRMLPLSGPAGMNGPFESAEPAQEHLMVDSRCVLLEDFFPCVQTVVKGPEVRPEHVTNFGDHQNVSG